MSRRFPPTVLLPAGAALLTAILVFLVSTELFPYHSINHDEGVYLQQARLLLDGRLWLEPSVPEAFHWWFFIEDGGRLYPKYAPVPAAVFSLGVALGTPQLSLALVAFGNALLVGLLTAEAFDRRTGVVAIGILAVTPLFIVQSATFLPYAVTTLFNLTFALGYVRAVRRESYAYAALAGLAVGVAFFARPFTAVLFALPFILHALYVLLATFLEEDLPALARYILLNSVVAVLGLLGVGLALYYNTLTTGEALVFPYQAFAPADGIGFGRREILGYSRVYTPELGLRANTLVLESFLTRWAFAPPVGPLLALVGLVVSVGRGAAILGPRAHAREADRVYNAFDEALRVTVAGVAVTVPVGNVFFWGNLNILSALSDPTDGLIASLGPFYHFDLLLPFSMFAAAALVFSWRALRNAARESDLSRNGTRVALSVVLVATLAIGGVATASAVADPLERNQQYTERYETVYEPFQDRAGGDWEGTPLGSDPGFDRGLVFTPDPYGQWLGHPFQSLLNRGDLGGPVVYAIDGSPERDFRVLAAHPERAPYRFTYRGVWSPDPADDVTADIEPLSVREGRTHEIRTTVGVVGRPSTVRIEVGAESARYDVEGDVGETLTVPWAVQPGEVRITGDSLVPRGDGVVTMEEYEEVALSVTFVQDGGATLTYRQELTVENRGGQVRLVWPPKTRVCRLTPDCGYEGTYLSGKGSYVDGVSLETTVESS